MVHHSKWLRLEGDRAGLTFGADAFWPLRMTRGTVRPHSVIWFAERRHVGALELRFVGSRVDLSEVRVK